MRGHGDTKTKLSRRSLGLPALAVQALRQLQAAEGRTTGLVFATRTGSPLDPANVRHEFRAACKAAGLDGNWSPRELRHTFVSLMSPVRRAHRRDSPAGRALHDRYDAAGLPPRAAAGHHHRGRGYG